MKNFHKLTVMACFFFTLNIAFAQDSLQKKHLVLKIAPLTMFDIDNTFEFAAEHRLGKQNRWTLSEQLGYGAGITNLWKQGNSNYENYGEQFRIKIEARRYKKANLDMTGFYTAYELFFKQVNDHISRSIGRECESGPCNYYENLDYPVSKYVVGITAKIGYQHRFKNEDKKKSKFVFDFYVGLGLRRIIIDHKIDGAAIQNNPWFFSEAWFGGFGRKDNAYNIPHGSFGIRFGYLVF
jgi:hypothetical protein